MGHSGLPHRDAGAAVVRPEDLGAAIDALTPDPSAIGQVRGVTDDARPVVRVGARGVDMVMGTHGSTHQAGDFVIILGDHILCDSPRAAAADMTPPKHGDGSDYTIDDIDPVEFNAAVARNPDVIANMDAAHERRHKLAG